MRVEDGRWGNVGNPRSPVRGHRASPAWEGSSRGGYRRTMTSRLTSICIDSADPLSLAHFWCGVLGWEIADESDGGISIAPSDRAWPVIDVLPVRDKKVQKNRLHLDLRADGISTNDELERLMSLGASKVDVGQPTDVERRQNSLPSGSASTTQVTSVG